MQPFGRKGRLEDERMLKGRGRYVADWNLPGQAYGHFVRSDRAHAEIAAVDASSALAMPGVIAVLTGADVAAAGLRPLPAAARSEEHTSELQSHSDLVCRLLLEKKKKRTKQR